MDARLGLDMALYAPARLAATDPERLVSSHLALVRKIAWHVHARVSSAIDIEDLVQIGMVSLIEAARAFEDRGHAAFATYATVRVRGAMIDQLRKGATLVRSAIRRRREWGIVRSALEGVLGRAASDAEMAEKLEITVEVFRQGVAATHAAHTESIDDVYSDHSDWFAHDGPDAFDQLESKTMRTAIAGAVSRLPEREAMVLQLYFVEELNLEEIGKVLGVGAARVCQIKKAALGKMRGQLKGWDAD
ncbi:DNA-directed RNA polymerase sigma-70 factor [Polymorphobacter glacialis]|uniref:DNA-directed RNA polymerase sigma-70 factor n=1 Tax=Sandarakinorhabdus glacialis TaxID=1614636 RepID=A0A917E3V0_9SPHN|nr:DNA-directed RNA polymerase sigma-70 factor [Polymorphobacter glacialis]